MLNTGVVRPDALSSSGQLHPLETTAHGRKDKDLEAGDSAHLQHGSENLLDGIDEIFEGVEPPFVDEEVIRRMKDE